jgi:hypothetical protein
MMQELVKALAVTTELLGVQWSKETARAVAEQLASYPLVDVQAALARCQRELRGRLTLADILDRLPHGHPGPDEAWAIVSRGLRNESVTIVWTDQMREAFGPALALADDPVAARMAFRDTYQRLVAEARVRGERPVWSVSRGTDHADQERQITEAVRTGKLTATQAQRLLPHHDLAELLRFASAAPRTIGGLETVQQPNSARR